jgi:hypothetical protein
VKDFRPLLEEIALCPIALSIRLGDSSTLAPYGTDTHPCTKIVGLQMHRRFQLPEPWSGHIDTAPILFISSNPSIDDLEIYPDQSWDSDTMMDFFRNRFTSEKKWVDRNLRVLQQNGLRSDWVRFWASARARVHEITGKSKQEIKPGIDFALTEIVHCKSKDEHGVREARDFCADRYLVRVLSISTAKVFVVFGKVAGDAMKSSFGSNMTSHSNHLRIVSIGGIPRVLAFLPHPSLPGPPKSLRDNIGQDGIQDMRAHLY